MKVTITTNYWSNEEFGCWDIHIENKTSKWSLKGSCRVIGTATLKREMIINRLNKDNLIDECILSAAAISCSPMGEKLNPIEISCIIYRLYSKEIFLSYSELHKAKLINKAIDEFCRDHNKIIEKTSFSVFDGLFGGNESSYHSARNKIIKEMKLDNFNKIYAQLKSYLKEKGLI